MKFVSYEIKPVIDDGDNCKIASDDADADFFSIYGRDENGLAHCIGDFITRAAAEQIRTAITNG